MQNRKLYGALALAAGALSLGLSSARLDEYALRDSDHKKMGKEVARYWSARAEKKGIMEAFQKLSTSIEKSDKKLKKMNVLSAVEDWEAIFRYATLEELDDKVKKGKLEEGKSPDGQVSYSYHVSKKYRAKSGPFPLILVVHDENSDAPGYVEASWADSGIRDACIIVGVHMDLAPEQWLGQDGIFRVMFTYGSAVKEFAVDMDKVFLAGSGKGFATAAATASAFPQLFAGLIGMGDIPEVDATNFRNLPTLLVGGSDGAKALAAKFGELGFESCTEIEGGTAADAWPWIQETGRDPYPMHISFTPGFLFAQKTQWLELEGVNLEEGPSVDAVVDRDANTITVAANKVTSVIIYLNDVLVDMDKPVKVVVNGTEHEKLFQRNKRKMIDLAFDQGDWGRVFTNVESYVVPQKSTE